jgi:hypothetical protein
MKLRKALSVFAIAILPMFAGVTQGCSVEEDPVAQSDNVTQLSDYDVNIEAANGIWSPATPFAEAKDLWTATVLIGDQAIPAPTHLFGDVINVIPYSNEDGGTDATGAAFERGDQEVAKVFQPGQVGIALKMHRPEKQVVDLNDADPSVMKEDFKLQDTHIEVVVGVEKAEHGQAGAITLNNPQGYEEGRFGNKTYSMVFMRPTFPSYVNAEQKAEYEKNIVAAAVMFNAVTDFPGDYNGGDPLAANSVETYKVYTEQAIKAATGDQAAQAWFKDPANQVYCAEFAYLSLSSVVDPLTASNLVPRIGQELWDAFVAEVDKHNRGVDEFQETGNLPSAENTSSFVELNSNKRAAMIRINLPSDSLQPMGSLSPNPDDNSKLALKWMTMSDIVRQFMRTHLPREILGEQMAPVQGAVLAKMKPGLLEQMGMDQMPEDDPRRVAVEALFAQIVQVVSTPYENYAAFQAALEPYAAQAAQITGPRDSAGSGAFVPPSLYHVVAQGHHDGGLLGIQYEGHGVHASATQKKQGASEPVTPTEDIDQTISCEAQCGGQAEGGCWCDSACSNYGDCCGDYAQVCSS